MSDEKPHLRDVDRSEAIGNAIWEAHACIGYWAITPELAADCSAQSIEERGSRDD